jgi:alkylation response protein AidB-like acyl-CoA dehydrogenase
MRFAFGDEQEELRRSVRRALDAHGGISAARKVLGGELGHDGALWSVLAKDLGLAGLIIPEEHGGAGLGWTEVAAVLEELGRTLAPVPFFSTVCLGTNALVACGAHAYLPAIASGDRTATLAFRDDARFVVDGDTADIVVLVEGDGIYVTEDAHRRRLPTVDQTRPLAEILGGTRTRIGSREQLDGILDRARIALAAEQVGGAQRCLDLAVDYAKVRHQFGKPIGSFQAIQHACAEMFLLVESARSAAYYAAWAADHGAHTDLAQTAATAAAYCSDAFFRVAGDAIQVHGGIGFTWEHDCHLFFKRARASRSLLGAPDHHRERVATALLGEGA